MLTEALEKNKRKYQMKIRKLEQQILAKMNEDKSRKSATPFKSSIPVPVGANKSQ